MKIFSILNNKKNDEDSQIGPCPGILKIPVNMCPTSSYGIFSQFQQPIFARYGKKRKSLKDSLSFVQMILIRVSLQNQFFAKKSIEFEKRCDCHS